MYTQIKAINLLKNEDIEFIFFRHVQYIVNYDNKNCHETKKLQTNNE